MVYPTNLNVAILILVKYNAQELKMKQKKSRQERCRILLDQALKFAMNHTDQLGRMTVEGEIDCKDSGWLVLGGVIRVLLYGNKLNSSDLTGYCRKWTLASIRVDDTRSAWTTFALLLAMDFSGGLQGFFHDSFSASEKQELRKFFLQLDMNELLAASRNYRIAAAVIDVLRCRFGYLESPCSDPDANIQYLLDGYLGEGFFNDDDGRGSREDRRIDAYSGEIIGLLLNYDGIYSDGSPFQEKIHSIIKEFCAANIYLIDQQGEFGKWGRSLRGEAEIKKVFLWEYAETRNLTADPGDGFAAADRMISFFEGNGISPEGRIYRDKAGDRGIWDEYTTIVQAQGYGIYGLAMACFYAADGETEKKLPSEVDSYVRYLSGPGIICANEVHSGVHYILPAANRMTKNMFFWHNRLTGECNVEVDVSAKFQSLPYFGKQIPAPYSAPELPLLPMLENSSGELLVPRGLQPDAWSVTPGNDQVEFRRLFHYCPVAAYAPAVEVTAEITLCCQPGKIGISAVFNDSSPAEFHPVIFVFEPSDDTLECRISIPDASCIKCTCPPSIYGNSTRAKKIIAENFDPIQYNVEYVKR